MVMIGFVGVATFDKPGTGATSILQSVSWRTSSTALSTRLDDYRYHAGIMVQKGSRVAAIYDVHGNLPALEAVLAELESLKPDLFVVGGDVVAGPMPTEVMDRLVTLGERTCFVRGNADREVVAAYDDRLHADPIDVADPAERVAAYAASRIDRKHRDLLASFAEHLIVEVEGLGQVLFCHGSPRSDEEILTAATTEGRLREILIGVDQDLVVCGHTHAQFDRLVGGKRVVNAGSVGMPYQGKPVGAFWLLLGAGGVSLRRSDYDLDRAVRRIRATGYPDAEEMAQILLEPPDPKWVADFFEQQAAGA
jgi:putative phosphoesterase